MQRLRMNFVAVKSRMVAILKRRTKELILRHDALVYSDCSGLFTPTLMRNLGAILMLSALAGFGATAPTPTETFDVRKFGAKGDGRTVETVAIQTAINRCRDAGGGTIIVPPGSYLTGTLRLFSNVHLIVQPGAVLKGSKELSDYMLD